MSELKLIIYLKIPAVGNWPEHFETIPIEAVIETSTPNLRQIGTT
jgi:hypothetical protein